MHYTIPQFMDRIVHQWDVKTSVDSGRVVFHYFAQYVAGKSSTLWNAVVNEHAKTIDLKNFAKWQECIRF